MGREKMFMLYTSKEVFGLGFSIDWYFKEISIWIPFTLFVIDWSGEFGFGSKRIRQ